MRNRWDHNQNDGMVVMVVVEHRQCFAKRHRDEAVKLQSNGRERGAQGLEYPLGASLPSIYRWRGVENNPCKP